MQISSDLDYANSSHKTAVRKAERHRMEMNGQETYEKLIVTLTTQLPSFNEKLSIWEQINSLQIYALLPLIEEAFGVEIYSVEMTSANFNSAENLARLLQEKIKAKESL